MIAPVLDLLFPRRCAACAALDAAAAPFCALCAEALEPVGVARCPLCGRPGAAEPCPDCLHEPPAFDSARAAFVLGGPISDAVHRFKYGDRPHLAGPLAELISPLAQALVDLVVPIPLHPRRLARRGYDQATLLARALAAAARKPLAHPRAVRRVRDTPPQVGRDRAGRAANVQGAFAADSRRVSGRRILLVDDVMTTGATASACARALKLAGAARVDVLTLARAD